MDLERTLKTQRLRLLRLVAGLLVLLGFLSVGPVSCGFSVSVCRFVGSILSRAEAATRYLLIAQARLVAARSGIALDQNRLSAALARAFVADETDASLSECRRRLKALRAVLLDFSRHASRLLHRIKKQMRRAERLSPRPEERLYPSLRGWRLAIIRIERPPKHSGYVCSHAALPQAPPEFRAGGAGRWSECCTANAVG